MLNLLAWGIVLAQQAPAGDQPPGGGASQFSFLLPLVVIFVLFWFLLIRPQKQKDKERQRILGALKKNDHVVTIGGIHGVVVSLKPEDDEVILKVDETSNVKLRVSRSAIARVVSSAEPAAKDE